MSFKKRAIKSVALALVGITVVMPCSQTVSAMDKGIRSSIEISSDFKVDFLRELENKKVKIMIL